MLPGATAYNSAPLLPILLAASSRPLFCAAVPWTGLLSRRQLILDYGPAPPPDQGPPASADALRDPAFLPAQIGAIVGAYALCLVIVALLLLAFSKRRRERIRNRDLPPNAELYLDFNPFPDPFLLQSEEEYKRQLEEFQSEQYLHEQYQHEQYQHEQYQHLHEQYPHEQFQNHRFSIQQVALQPASLQQVAFQKLSLQTDFPGSPARNFSLPASASPLSPTRTGPFPFSPTKSHHSAFTTSSPTSTILAPGIDLSVDQSVVHRDRTMAQQQLEEMYKHVMEQEQAKLEGREYHAPTLASPASNSVSASPAKAGGLKKERNKPSNLNLARDDKAESRGSSIFSFLKSPRKNKAGGMTISSPIMTPMSGTFPRGHHDDQELNAMAPRYYAPPAAPPAQSDLPFRRVAAAGSTAGGSSHLPTPDMSPISTQSIDSRIDAAIVGHPPPPRTSRREPRSDDRLPSHSRDVSTATSSTNGNEPVSAGSERSTSHLVGLPLSPRPGVNRFPSLDSLPASPRPGQQTFAFPAIPAGNPPNNMSTTSIPRSGSAAPSGYSATAVRTGGALPLRAYETAAAQPSSLTSPTAVSFAAAPTKQTVFTRGPMSPGGPQTAGLRTPWTGAPVPYTPYQPFSPVVPITPTVVTRADRKRMKKFEPKTPTVEMVRDEEDVW